MGAPAAAPPPHPPQEESTPPPPSYTTTLPPYYSAYYPAPPHPLPPTSQSGSSLTHILSQPPPPPRGPLSHCGPPAHFSCRPPSCLPWPPCGQAKPSFTLWPPVRRGTWRSTCTTLTWRTRWSRDRNYVGTSQGADQPRDTKQLVIREESKLSRTDAENCQGSSGLKKHF